MINTSNEYKRVIQGSRTYIVRLKIEFRDHTAITVENDRIISNTVNIEDAVSNNGSFDIGAAIINQLKVSLYNGDEYFSRYDFEGAVIYPYIGIQLDNTIEFLKKGVFIIEEAVTGNAVISLQALDRMTKFERPYSESSLTYPATLNDIVRDACEVCGVSLGTARFDHDDYMVQNRPGDEKITFREIISYVAEAAGCYARFNVDGNLEIKWYDFGVFEEMPGVSGGSFDKEQEGTYQSGDILDGGLFSQSGEGDTLEGGLFSKMKKYHHIYRISSKSISTDDVVITGVKVTVEKQDSGSEEEENWFAGQEGYVLTVEKNPLIQQGKAQEEAEYLGRKLIGIRFRPMEVSALADPSVEAGDPVFVSDMKGNSYQTVLTRVSFSMGSLEKYVCDAESPQRKSAARYTSATKAVVEARRNAKVEIDNYSKAVLQMNQMAANTLGFYYTEARQEDGSVIVFRHDKPSLQESQIIYKSGADGFFVSTDGGLTYTSGFDKDGNAVMNILSAIGINADWIDAGSITADRIKGGTLTLGGEHGFGEMNMVDNAGNIVAYMTQHGLIISNLGYIFFEDENYILKARYDSYGAQYFERGRLVGRISTAHKTEHPEVKGLSFLLDMDGEVMSWSVKQDPLETMYYPVMEYYRPNSIRKEGLHFYTPVYTYRYLNLGDSDMVHSVGYTNGTAGFAIKSGSFVLAEESGNYILEVNPSEVKFYTNGNKTVHCWNHLDLHGNSLLNQSDVRLKEHIHDTKVQALKMLNKIELKEFDWIEEGTHEDIGMIAQQLKEIEPELVVEDAEDGHLSIKETKLIPYLIKAVQELYAMQSGVMKTSSGKWQEPYVKEEKQEFIEKLEKGTYRAEPVNHKEECIRIEEEEKYGNSDKKR